MTPPDQPVDVLLVVVSAPWMRAAEAVDFARLVGAPRNLAIHDRVYSDAGLAIVASIATMHGGELSLESANPGLLCGLVYHIPDFCIVLCRICAAPSGCFVWLFRKRRVL